MTGIFFICTRFENTPQNARDILRNLGQNIDIVAGPFDQDFLDTRKCAGLELLQAPIRCAVSIYHPLASKTSLTAEELHGEDFMLIRRGWNIYLDAMRDELWQLHFWTRWRHCTSQMCTIIVSKGRSIEQMAQI